MTVYWAKSQETTNNGVFFSGSRHPHQSNTKLINIASSKLATWRVYDVIIKPTFLWSSPIWSHDLLNLLASTLVSPLNWWSCVHSHYKREKIFKKLYTHIEWFLIHTYYIRLVMSSYTILCYEYIISKKELIAWWLWTALRYPNQRAWAESALGRRGGIPSDDT